MIFCNFLLRVNDEREASLDDFRDIINNGMYTKKWDYKKYFYVISMEIIENRFFWMVCDYDNSKMFRYYVVDRESGEKEPNPRTKKQIEPRRQLFVCYDCETNFLYMNDMTKRSFVKEYFSEATKRKYQINNVYASVDEFCNRIKVLTGFRFIQIDDLFARDNDLFKQIGTISGKDFPEDVYLKVSYNNIPILERGRSIINYFLKRKEQFKDIIIVGCDDEGIEQTFDFSSILKRIEIAPTKDEDEHLNPEEVKFLLLSRLR